MTKCQKHPDCNAFNYAKPGYGGSDGPGDTSESTGCCYYRSNVDCGNRCDGGRTCYVAQDARCRCSVSDGDLGCTYMDEPQQCSRVSASRGTSFSFGIFWRFVAMSAAAFIA